MTAPLPDDDLLALIEGELAPERIERIRTVLMRDPELMRSLEAMQRDRARLQHTGQSWSAHTAPDASRLVRDALEQAEREALLHVGGARQHAANRHRGGRHSSSRRATMLAGAIVGLIAVAGASWIVFERTKPSQQIAEAPKLKTRGDEPALVIAPPTALAELAGPPSVVDTGITTPTFADAAPALPDTSLTEEWLRSAGMTPADTVADSAASRESGARGTLTISQAAQLALEGRLKLVTDRSPSSVATAMASVPSQPGPLAGPTLDLSSMFGESATREVTLRVSPGSDFQKELEHELARTVQQLVLGSGASIRFVAVDRPGPLPAPSMTFEDILWWSRPTSEWRQRVEVRIPLVKEDAPASPETPLSPTN